MPKMEPLTDFERMAQLLASGVPGAITSYELPAALGRGRVTLVAAEPGLLLALRHLWLLSEQVTHRAGARPEADMLLVSFQLRRAAADRAWQLATVLLTSEDVGFTTRLPAHTDLFTVSLAVRKSLLATWFTPPTDWLAALLAARTPVAYDTLGTPDLLRVLQELARDRPSGQAWDGFFYRLKVQELLYYVFQELSQRATTPGYALRAAEVEALFRVRDQVVASLAVPPSLPQLARAAGLHEAKLSGLFRQVFGTSLYQYYQAARMSEAAQRLARYSVSEVGYQLGFTNLSHFTRLFARHHGLNPKQYQARLATNQLGSELD
jgi:AraC-like DNA-binding protein